MSTHHLEDALVILRCALRKPRKSRRRHDPWVPHLSLVKEPKESVREAQCQADADLLESDAVRQVRRTSIDGRQRCDAYICEKNVLVERICSALDDCVDTLEKSRPNQDLSTVVMHLALKIGEVQQLREDIDILDSHLNAHLGMMGGNVDFGPLFEMCELDDWIDEMKSWAADLKLHPGTVS